MPTESLSLLGFLDERAAMHHLENDCVFENPSPSLRMAEWQIARSSLGEPEGTPGTPNMRPMPPEATSHIAALGQVLFATGILGDATLAPPIFQMVEIEPLLAFQHTLSIHRSNDHCAQFVEPPSDMMMLPVCLPLMPEMDNVQVYGQQNSMLIKAKSLNMRYHKPFQNGPIAGIVFGPSPPFVTVVELNGRHFLWNGFHRAYGLRRAGATHMPCMVRKSVNDAALLPVATGIFPLDLLMSDNPPTVGHYTRGKAHLIKQKTMHRIMHISWAEWAVPDDYPIPDIP